MTPAMQQAESTNGTAPSTPPAFSHQQNFAAVPLWVFDVEMSTLAFKLYVALLGHSNWQTGKSRVGITRLANVCGRGLTQTKEALRELVDVGLLAIQSGKASGRSNHYEVRTIAFQGGSRATDQGSPENRLQNDTSSTRGSETTSPPVPRGQAARTSASPKGGWNKDVKAAVDRFLAWFSSRWEDSRGTAYVEGIKDRGCAKSLLDQHSKQDIQTRAEAMLAKDDDWWWENASVTALRRRWNGLAPKPASQGLSGAKVQGRGAQAASEAEAVKAWSNWIDHRDGRPVEDECTPRAQAALDHVGGLKKLRTMTTQDATFVRRDFIRMFQEWKG